MMYNAALNVTVKNIRKTSSISKTITDIPQMPQAQVTQHIINHYKCNNCNHITTPKTDSISGTGFGPNIISYITNLWNNRVPLGRIALFVTDMFDVPCSASIIQNALYSVSESLADSASQIKHDISSSDVVHYDETGNKIAGKNGWIWVANTSQSVMIYCAYGKSSAVIQEHLPMCKQVAICDGHAAYRIFPTIQRCWAHILREAETLALRTDDIRTRQLHVTLQNLYCKIRSSDDINPDWVVQHTLSIANSYMNIKQKQFGRKLEIAAPNLVTFLEYDGVDTTNNAAEHQLREVVVHRKVRGQMINEKGMKMFGILMTSYLTWRRCGLNIKDMLLKCLKGT